MRKTLSSQCLGQDREQQLSEFGGAAHPDKEAAKAFVLSQLGVCCDVLR